jgi:hypothetical protein
MEMRKSLRPKDNEETDWLSIIKVNF